MHCQHCQFDNPAGARFCQTCGKSFSGHLASSEHEAERRQLTVLFCDLVGSTDLAGRLDPEDLRDVIGEYQRAAGEAILRFDGFIARYVGDGLLVFFGYPRAHDDSPERAVRAALAILDGLRELNANSRVTRGLKLAARIAVHTGGVVVGRSGGDAIDVFGDTPNLAARLQEVAGPDGVVISEATLRLVRGLFSTEDLGPRSLKGFARPVSAYRVLGPTGLRGRFVPFDEAGLTAFIDRVEPLRALLDVWEETRRGSGRVAVISGEPGIGKSRLARALRERFADDPHLWLEAQCSPWTENTAFYPVIELNKRLLALGDTGTPTEKLSRFETALDGVGLAVDENLPLVAALHGIPLPEGRQAPALSREAQRRKTLEMLCAWLLRLGRERPVVLFVEDVQWIDPSTAELIGQVLEHVAEQPLLVLLTHRSGFTLPWTAERAVEVSLDRFGEDEAMRVVEEVVSGGSFPTERLAELVVRGEGVPLYLEELTKAAIESTTAHDTAGGAPRAQPTQPVTIPATLRDSLMSRLDRLGTAKEVALLASVIGREFTYPLLAAASQGEEPTLRTHLERLVDSELVFQMGEPPDATYRFKHALIRDEAYQSLIRTARRRYHLQVATALEAKFPGETAARPELVGNHFIEGGDTEKGVLYLMMAARRAVTTSANVEALRHAERALEVLATQPASPARSQMEMALCTIRGGALIALRGYASPEVQQTFAQARDRASELGDSPQLVPVLHGLWLFHMVRGDRRETVELADQLLAIAESSEDLTARLFGLTVAGIQRFFEGRFQPSIEYIERAYALYDPKLHAPLAVTYSLGTAGVARANAATCYWFLGYPDRARSLCREVLESARRDGHLVTLVGVEVMTTMVYHLCGDTVTVRELADDALRIATEQGFALWIGSALAAIGWADAVAGDVDGGIARAREGLARFRATGAETAIAYLFGRVAELCHMAGRLDEATEAADEALALSERNFDGFFAADLFREKGELTLARTGDEGAASAFFERARDMARAESAKSLELRAAMSLARLAERRGDRRKAFDLVAPIYEWFSEGFDTRDLREARDLLDRLR
jgi:class 3 adenylate cyclase/predicted ATPase